MRNVTIDINKATPKSIASAVIIFDQSPFVKMYAAAERIEYNTIPPKKTQVLNFCVKNEANVNAASERFAKSNNFSPYRKFCSLVNLTHQSITPDSGGVN